MINLKGFVVYDDNWCQISIIYVPTVTVTVVCDDETISLVGVKIFCEHIWSQNIIK